MRIEVTFPLSIAPATIKKIIEGNMEENSDYSCKVIFKGIEDNENVFYIESESASAFYLIGITAGGIMEKYSNK